MVKVQVRTFTVLFLILTYVRMMDLGVQNEPPNKKQRISDNTEPMIPSTPPQPETSSMVKKD